MRKIIFVCSQPFFVHSQPYFALRDFQYSKQVFAPYRVCLRQNENISIDNSIYIKVFYDGNVPYHMVSVDYFFKTTNNEIAFLEITRVFEEHFQMKVQEVFFLYYVNYRIFHSPLGFSVVNNYHIMELVNEWFPDGKYRNVDTHFSTYYTYE